MCVVRTWRVTEEVRGGRHAHRAPASSAWSRIRRAGRPLPGSDGGPRSLERRERRVVDVRLTLMRSMAGADDFRPRLGPDTRGDARGRRRRGRDGGRSPLPSARAVPPKSTRTDRRAARRTHCPTAPVRDTAPTAGCRPNHRTTRTRRRGRPRTTGPCSAGTHRARRGRSRRSPPPPAMSPSAAEADPAALTRHEPLRSCSAGTPPARREPSP